MVDLSATYGAWALVTGASSGIGEAFARALAAEGMNVAIAARRRDRLVALAGELEAVGAQAHVVEADLATDAGVDAVVAACDALEVGLLVSNAGFGLKGTFLDIPLERQREMVRVNCLATLELAHRVGALLRARKRGAIVITSSTAAWQGIPLSAAYAASKSFGLLLAEGLAAELKDDGVDVVALCPGATATEGPTRTGVDPDRVPGAMMSPEAVVDAGLAALGRKAVVVPGWHNWLGTQATRWVPRRLASSIAGRAIERATGTRAPVAGQ
jgi:short-subunit dehydrogenase